MAKKSAIAGQNEVHDTFFRQLLYCGCDENRSFSSAITQEQNSGFHTEQSIGEPTKVTGCIATIGCTTLGNSLCP